MPGVQVKKNNRSHFSEICASSFSKRGAFCLEKKKEGMDKLFLNAPRHPQSSVNDSIVSMSYKQPGKHPTHAKSSLGPPTCIPIKAITTCKS